MIIGGRFGAASAGEDGRRLLALDAARGEADVMLAAEGRRLVNLRGELNVAWGDSRPWFRIPIESTLMRREKFVVTFKGGCAGSCGSTE